MKTFSKMAIVIAVGSAAAFASGDVNSSIDAKAIFDAKCASCHGAMAE